MMYMGQPEWDDRVFEMQKRLNEAVLDKMIAWLNGLPDGEFILIFDVPAKAPERNRPLTIGEGKE